MKKFLSLMLVALLVLSFAACGDKEEGGDTSFGGGNASKVEIDDNNDTSKPNTNTDNSQTSSDVSGDNNDVPEVTTTNKYMTWARRYYATPAMGQAHYGPNDTAPVRGINKTTKDDATSLNFTKVNEAVEAGDAGAFTSDFGSDISTEGQDYAEFYVAVYEYDHSVYTYVRKAAYDIGSANGEIAIPADGFVVAIHKDHAKLTVVKGLAANTPVFPAGLDISDELDSTIYATTGTITVDGKLNENDWDLVWEMNPDDGKTNYGQFNQGEYPATAEVYMTYDEQYFYIGVIVYTNIHDNKVTSGNLGAMWNSECIQFNISSMTADSEYLTEHWYYAVDQTLSNENIVRQYNVCLNNDGESLYDMTMNEAHTSDMDFLVTYENNQLVYEIAVPWSECGAEGETIEGVAGTEFGFAVSVNYCKPEVDANGNETSIFRVISLRDGASIIGINDYTKIPTITLG